MPAKICRVCFEEGTDLRDLGIGTSSTGSKLSACVPEINVYIVENPMICRPCLCMVEVAYKLRETCLENEKRFNQNFDRNDFVISKKVSQVKKENTADKEQQENKDVSVVFNDFFDESGVLNIDSKQILKTERNHDFPQTPFGNNDDEMPIDEVPQIKTEVFEPEESLLEISEEYITTGSNDSFISRTNSEGISEYSCNMCNRSFTGMKYLKIHLNKMHYNIGSKKAKFECEICFKTFTTKGGVAMHSKSCRNIKKLKHKYNTNNMQEINESNSSTARSNISDLPEQSNDTFTCEKCLKIFTTRASFRVHSKHCSEEFLDETELNIESINPLMMATKTVIDDPMTSKLNEDIIDSSDGVDSDYDPDSPDVESDGSDFSIGRRKRKSRGRNSWGITGGEQYKRRCVDLQIQCDKCSRTFMTKSAISNHSKSCMNINVMAKQAEENETQNPEQREDTLVTEFINVEGSEMVKSEDDKTEHVCKICEEKCLNQKSLEEHVSKHIDVSAAASGTNQVRNTEAITCCGKEYTTVSLLQLHTYKEHGKSCGVCNKHFTSYNELFAHLLEHTKE